MATCTATKCTETGTHVWQRNATDDEVERLRTDPAIPSVQPDEADAKIPVYACDTHYTPQLEQVAHLVHDAGCTAPTTACNCSADAP